MKKHLHLLVFFGCLILNLSIVSAQSKPELLWYKFDQVGTSVTNYASNPPSGTATGTLMGAITQGGSGQCGGAIIGSGITSTTDYVNTNWVTSFPTRAWTISFWTSNITGTTTLYYIFGDANAGSFRCFTNGAAGATNWILRGGGAFTDVTINGGATATPSLSTFVYDSLAGNIKGYLNGALVTTVAQGSPVIISGIGPFKVNGYGSNVGLPASGYMDEFRIYNRALSAAEVLSLLDMSTFDTISVAQCDPYTSPSGLHTWNVPGIYSDTIPNSTGCDSIISIDYTLSTTSVLNIDACYSYSSPSGNYLWHSSGVYYDTVSNASGCDTLFVINLNISNVNLGVVQIDYNLGSLQPTGAYQWLDCDNAMAPILGENVQSFTPAIDGNYAVQVSNGACLDTSACFNISGIGIQENLSSLSVEITPNPNNGLFTVTSAEIPALIEVIDAIGNTQIVLQPNAKVSVINLRKLANGVYYVKVTGQHTTHVSRMLITK